VRGVWKGGGGGEETEGGRCGWGDGDGGDGVCGE